MAKKYRELLQEGDSLSATNLTAAEDCYAEALKIADAKNNKIKQTEILERLGDVYLASRDDVKFQRIYPKDPYIKSIALYNAAIVRNDKEIKNNANNSVKEDLLNKIEKSEKLFLESIGISSKQSTSIEFYYEHILNYEELINKTKESLKKITEQYKHPGTTINTEIEKAVAIRELYKQIAVNMQKFITILTEESKNVLGQPPCKYAIVGTGSRARQEVTPHSDFDFLILIESKLEEHKEYFRNLTNLLHIKILNLGRTILPCMSIRSLNDFYSDDPLKQNRFFDTDSPRGLSFDSLKPDANKFPLGRKDKNGTTVFELIGTPSEIASYHTVKETEKIGDELMSHELRSVILLEGNMQLLEAYNAEVKKILNAREENGYLALGQKRALALLKKDLIIFKLKIIDQALEGKPFDAKKEIYRVPSILLEILSYLFNIDGGSNWDKVEEINKIINLEGGVCEGCNNLKIALSLAALQRLQTYIDNDGRESSHIEDESTIFRFYYTVFPFYKLVEEVYKQVAKLSTTENINISILLVPLSNNKLFDDSEFIKGMVNKRLMHLLDAEENFIASVKKIEAFDAYNTLGIIQIDLAKYLNALINLDTGLHIGSNNQDKNLGYILSAKIILNKGHAHLRQYNYNETFRFYNLALKKLEKINYKFLDHEENLAYNAKDIAKQKILIKQSLGLACITFHKFAEGIKLLHEAKEELYKENTGNEYNFDTALILNNIGLGYIKLSNFTEAEKALYHSLKIAQFLYKRDDHPSIIQVNHNLGILYTYLSQFNNASQYFEANYPLFQKIYGKHYIKRPEYGQLLMDHANLFANQGNVNDARKKYEESLNVVKTIYGGDENNPNPALITRWINLMIVDKMNLQNKYSEKLEKLLAIQNPQLTPYSKFVILMNLGGFYIKKSNTESQKYWDQTLQLGENIFQEHTQVISCLKYVNVIRNIDINKHREGINVLKEIYEFDKSNQASVLIIHWIDSMMKEFNTNFNNQYADILKKELTNKGRFKLDNYQKFAILTHLISFYIENGILMNQKYWNQALDLGRSIFQDHPTIELADLIENIALNEFNISKKLTLDKEVMQMRSSIFNKNLHPDIMKSYSYLALDYYNLGNYNIAKDFILKAHEFRKNLSELDEITIRYVYKKMDDHLISINGNSLGSSAIIDFIEKQLAKNILSTKQTSEAISHQNQILDDYFCPNNYLVDEIFSEKCYVGWDYI